MNDQGVYRTAPTTPGLLKIYKYACLRLYKIFPKKGAKQDAGNSIFNTESKNSTITSQHIMDQEESAYNHSFVCLCVQIVALMPKKYDKFRRTNLNNVCHVS